ncbi:MAG: DUF1501 domain-containing protein [Planctomycetes bacterium]|nr:DUF1501 domain-containing protein [Planctomycetota bacterium]
MQDPLRSQTRRRVLQTGASSLAGLSLASGSAWQSVAAEATRPASRPRAVIYLFMTGGPSQHDTFDMKPDGPAEYKGEFDPIPTRTPGTHICEHLPMLADRSHLWSLVRSLTHTDNGHDRGTYIMLTGRTDIPATFRSSRPQSSDWPSIAAISGASTTRRQNLPTSVILPEKLYHSNAGVYPGQFAGLLGSRHEPWLIEATDKPHAYHSYSGAFPEYLFNLHKGEPSDKRDWRFEVPHLSLQEGVLTDRFVRRRTLLKHIEDRQPTLSQHAAVAKYDRNTQSAITMMTDSKLRAALDVRSSNAKTLERYGDNSFGWSLLMARRLVEAGVNTVQVNLGNFGSWDLHGNNFPLLKNYLFPPTDRAVSALLDDLHDSGLLDSTLVVLAGEFGRTPKITHIAQHIYKLPGRDHWAPLQSVLFAGGGVQGGRVIGTSDRNGAYPASDPQKPENFASTIYHALGIPRDAVWHDLLGRPNHVYLADPIEGLFG